MSETGPRLSPIIANSRMIVRGQAPHCEWLKPNREWSPNIFDAARFELNELNKAKRWLRREIEAAAAKVGEIRRVLEELLESQEAKEVGNGR